jgi:hypothetical protein
LVAVHRFSLRGLRVCRAWGELYRFR